MLRAQERAGERLVGLVDEGRGRFGAGFGLGRVQVRVEAGLEAQKLAAEGDEVYGKGGGRGRAVGEGFGECVVVSLGRRGGRRR